MDGKFSRPWAVVRIPGRPAGRPADLVYPAPVPAPIPAHVPPRSLLENGSLVAFPIRNEHHGGDLDENGCFPIRKRFAPARTHGMKSFPSFKMDH